MNQIKEKRAEVEKFFNPALIIANEHQTGRSPSGNYRLDIDVYAVNDPERNWCISTATMTDLHTNEVIAQIKRNDDRFFYAWIDCEETEYLICSEDLEGQTVVDLTHRRMASYCSNEDPFIWTAFYPSPGRDKIAITGCYWASPYCVAVYRFQNPLQLPLERIIEIPLSDNLSFEKWIGNDMLCFKDKNGGFQTHQVI
jgi:hypothetical protein